MFRNEYIKKPTPIFPLSPKTEIREMAVNPDRQAIITSAQPIYVKAATYRFVT